jgi:hypothetical protein
MFQEISPGARHRQFAGISNREECKRRPWTKRVTRVMLDEAPGSRWQIAELAAGAARNCTH